MKAQNILEPLFRTIDKVFFGFEEINEIEKLPDYLESENDDEFDAERSSN